uniref:PBCV-1 P7 disulphide-bonded domain-containing protein n=1 Tax=Chromera velia CCMP2878 TaxID=1169474 RepID=A0A0G4F943_9ALVE|eukprot:Cvel_2933.t1-p1 / transcript=Cvel_2933.t1 / gene=Cvel_2933 / organism=Chromera_velia_CCMP2878 / gene_product=hypothetical protein / transcript_product=hypothetical protein / location=Cvel_scaffold116:18037-18495(+) / protein_length=153 / sequence_SO=supercontig / SO=protein_coding / is_pseudo=false
MILTYTTETIFETAHSEQVSAVAQKSTMMVSKMGFRTETISKTVIPTTTYRTESSTTYSCPAGTVDTGSACASTVSVPAEFSCPAGSSSGSAAGGCTKTTYTQVTSCPEGFTDTGKKYVATASIPATTMAAPAPKGKYSTPTKHSRHHGHKHD